MIRTHSNTKTIWTYILIGLLMGCCYLIIFYGHRYSGNLEVVGLLGSLISVLAIQGLWFDTKGKLHKLKSFSITICLLVPLGLFVFTSRKWYRNKQLSEHGVVAYGKVIELYKTRGKSSTNHYARIRYMINNKELIEKVSNSAFYYKEGDSLKILCSSEDPEIFKVESVVKRD